MPKALKDLNELGPAFFAQTIETSGVGETSHVRLKGPLTLHRFGSIDFREPQCWFGADEYARALAHARRGSTRSGGYGDAMIRYLRRRLAVRLDWNDLVSFWSLHLPEGVAVDAFRSLIRAQPLATEPPGRVPLAAGAMPTLSGGAVQYWLFPVPAWIEHRPEFLKGG